VKEKAQNKYVEFKTVLNHDTVFGFSSISWEFDGVLTKAKPPILVNSTFLLFSEITREHSGVYTLSIETCHGDDCNTSTGSIKLDVQCKYYQ
jgi:hypothetical protein